MTIRDRVMREVRELEWWLDNSHNNTCIFYTPKWKLLLEMLKYRFS